MRRSKRNKSQYLAYFVIVAITVIGVVWMIVPASQTDEDPALVEFRQSISDSVAFERLDNVIARYGEIEIPESAVAGPLSTWSQAPEPFDRDRIIKIAVDAAIVRGLKLQIAEQEQLAGSINEATRSMEHQRALCPTNPNCTALVDAVVSEGLAESHEDYWAQSIAGYQEGISISNVNRFLVGDPESDVKLRSSPTAWSDAIQAVDRELMADVEIEWLDDDIAASYQAASQ